MGDVTLQAVWFLVAVSLSPTPVDMRARLWHRDMVASTRTFATEEACYDFAVHDEHAPGEGSKAVGLVCMRGFIRPAEGG